MRFITRLLFLLLPFFVLETEAQSFNGATGVIADNGNTISFPIVVSGIPVSTLDTVFGLESVCLTIQHNYVSDLAIRLKSPDNNIIDLSYRNGGSGNNYFNTCFVDSVNNIVTAGNAPFSGNWRPQEPLYNLNNGQNPNGIWILEIQDLDFGYVGSLQNLVLTFGNNPGAPLSFASSNLPIIKINTLNQTIVDDPKINCLMQVIDNGQGNRNYVTDTNYTYNGWIGIELRGSSSQTFPKKSYGVETRDPAFTDTAVALLGMPAESDWVFNANYTDKSFMRNTLSYDLYSKMNRYASRTRYAEVFINNNYQGIYVICEKIKRDSNRVDIANLSPADTAWPAVSGGYILKVDKTTGSGGQGFQSLYTPPSGGTKPTILFDYPDYTDMMVQQVSYIVSYMDSFERALNSPQFADTAIGYRRFADMSSFIDFFLMNEVTHCVDAYRISAYVYKEKSVSGGKLYAGPVWDYDIAWGNADYYNGNLTSGWSYQFPYTGDPYQVPFWWSRFLQDANFTNTMRCRWNNLRSGAFSTPVIHAWIDSVALVLQESQQRNFNVWPILGTYVWPNPLPLPTTYAGEVAQLKNWITGRLNWLDQNLPGTCIPTGITETAGKNFTVYPNPATDRIHIVQTTGTVLKYSLMDITGKEIAIQPVTQNDGTLQFNTAGISRGVYLLVATTQDKTTRYEKIILQ